MARQPTTRPEASTVDDNDPDHQALVVQFPYPFQKEAMRHLQEAISPSGGGF